MNASLKCHGIPDEGFGRRLQAGGERPPPFSLLPTRKKYAPAERADKGREDKGRGDRNKGNCSLPFHPPRSFYGFAPIVAVMTGLIKRLQSVLREAGIKTSKYVDEGQVLGESGAEARQDMEILYSAAEEDIAGAREGFEISGLQQHSYKWSIGLARRSRMSY